MTESIVVTQMMGEEVGAIVRITHSFSSTGEALEAIRKGILAWQQTPEGAAAYKDSCSDFNWGDYFSYGNQVPIDGITNIEWLFDSDVELVDHDELLMTS